MHLLCPIAFKALASPTETSVRELLQEYGLDAGDGLLVSLNSVANNLAGYSIICEPPIGVGGLDDVRVLSFAAANSVDAALKDIERGERADLEFKSSMFLDLRRFRAEPGEPLENYRLEGVTRTLMKTIAAFANTGGGTIYVGVEDDTNVCGLEQDFTLANPERSDFDGWDQSLRGQVESRFFDGKAVANYVKAVPLQHADQTFVQLQVGNRAALTFLKKAGGGAELYIRSGTRSIPIEYQEIEKHYRCMRQF